MSSGVCGNDNRTTSYDLSYTLQSACSITLDGNIKRMRKESNKSNEHEQSGQSSESDIVTADTCTAATCTCARTSSRNGYRIPCKCTSGSTATRSAEHTSFPCAHCNDYDPRDISTASDYIERDYADYINATGASREDTCSGVRDSDESRNFKQADADSRDSVERRIGIPAGVTI